MIFLKPSTSTGYFSNSTGSSVTSCRFLPVHCPSSTVLIHCGGPTMSETCLSSQLQHPDSDISSANSKYRNLCNLHGTPSVSEEVFGHYRSRSQCFQVNRLHIDDIFRIFFINFEVHSINSSETIGNFPKALNFNRLFLELNWFIYHYIR